MVLLYQILVILSALVVSLISLDFIMKKFVLSFQIKAVLFLPLLLFVLGFLMRLTEDKAIVDTGFFFTDFSYIFVYLLFALSFLLGQFKYWKKK